jgi:hypothetical protein
MLPTATGPVPRPMPTASAPCPAAARSALKAWIAARMSSAASTACRACRGLATGAPQNAITQSPMYLSMVPWWRAMTPLRRSSSSRSSACSSAGGRVSARLVKPFRSQNMIVSSSVRACMS